MALTISIVNALIVSNVKQYTLIMGTKDKNKEEGGNHRDIESNP